MIRVRTIGETSIAVGERPIRADAELLFATVLYLAVERGRRVNREALCSLLWPRENAGRGSPRA
jgi:DNA-binding SARP family transcriptional activator